MARRPPAARKNGAQTFMERRGTAKAVPNAPGIFDTIALGMSVVLAQPLLLLVPVVVDAYLWLGARLSPRALTDALGRWLERTGGEDGRQLGDRLRDLGESSDMTGLLSLFVPSVLSWVDRSEIADVWGGTVVRPSGPWVVLIGIALLGVSLALGVLFRVPLAFDVRGVRPTVGRIARAAAVAWVRYLGFLLLVAALVALVLGPAVVLSGLLLLVGINIVPLLTLVIVVPALWAMIFLYFAPDAIVVNEVGPIRAGYLSFNVVRRNFWPSVGFIVVVFVISVGLPLVWARFLDNAPGVLLALLGNAFIATGLALAQMRFFYDRLSRWRADLIPAPVPSP